MIALALMLLAADATAPPAPDCRYDRAAMLALSEDAFDQDMKGGWRGLQMRGCPAEAADLLRDYRDAQTRNHPSILFWHEGQLRAMLGQNDAAVALFAKAYHPVAGDAFGWNLYVDGSIAFLRHDRAALQQARDALARLPAPDPLPSRIVNGQRVPMSWPSPNLAILDELLGCFDKPYREAYGRAACKVPPASAG